MRGHFRSVVIEDLLDDMLGDVTVDEGRSECLVRALSVFMNIRVAIGLA